MQPLLALALPFLWSSVVRQQRKCGSMPCKRSVDGTNIYCPWLGWARISNAYSVSWPAAARNYLGRQGWLLPRSTATSVFQSSGPICELHLADWEWKLVHSYRATGTGYTQSTVLSWSFIGWKWWWQSRYKNYFLQVPGYSWGLHTYKYLVQKAQTKGKLTSGTSVSYKTRNHDDTKNVSAPMN